MGEPDGVDYDVAICGAGPVGTALALFLAETRPAARIALIDARTLEQAQLDARFIAISHGSRTLLERIGAWNDGVATAIGHIHVSQRGHFGRTLIAADDYGLPALGYVVRYGDLVRELAAASARRGVTTIRPATVAEVAQSANAVQITLEADGVSRAFSARYAIHAEGGGFRSPASGRSSGQSAADPKVFRRDYGQSAITAFVTCTLPHHGTAWERFAEHGPIALLPYSHGGGENNAGGELGYALVWCCTPEDADRRVRLDDEAFLRELHQNFGDRLGEFASVGARKLFPLALSVVETTVDGREFAIGNSAQTLHPVAGQGLNLGFRDAFSLAAALRGHWDDPVRCAADFKAARRLDRAATIRLTDFMPRIFSSPLFPVVAARGAALAALDLLPPLRRVLARHMIDGQRNSSLF